MDNNALNKAIAENVFGYAEIERRICSRYPDDSTWEDAQYHLEESAARLGYTGQMEPQGDFQAWKWCYKHHYKAGSEWIPIPDYSTDIASVFTVVTRMRDLGFSSKHKDVSIEWGTEMYRWSFKSDKIGVSYEHREKTIPLAICHAALRMIASVQRG